MAEIKSTMDLIMEKTRHLSMTEDEKKEKRQQDARQELQGLICKIEDKTIKTTEFEKSYETIKSTYHDGQAVDVDAMLRDELINRLDLDADNTARLQLLGRYFNIDTQQFFELFSAYNTALDHARQTRLARRKQQLAQDRQISGTAVIPNLAADSDWAQEIDQLKSEYGKRLDALKQKSAEA